MPPEVFDRVEVGNRIKRLRTSQNLTVQELADRSSVSAGYISEVERGKSSISLEKLKQIADGLGVGLDAIISGPSAGHSDQGVVQIPAALSAAAERLNLSHRATLTLLQGQRSLMARRSRADEREWDVEAWLRFHDQVKEYLPDS